MFLLAKVFFNCISQWFESSGQVKHIKLVRPVDGTPVYPSLVNNALTTYKQVCLDMNQFFATLIFVVCSGQHILTSMTLFWSISRTFQRTLLFALYSLANLPS